MQRRFKGKKTLAQLQQDCMDVQSTKKANLTQIEGRNAKLPDGKKEKVNVCDFELKDDEKDVHDDLTLVKKDDADVDFLAKMTQEKRKQIGEEMDVFIENKAATILVFGKTT